MQKLWLAAAASLMLAGAITACGASSELVRTVPPIGGEWDWAQTCAPKDPTVRQLGHLLAPHRIPHVEGETMIIWHAHRGRISLSAPVHSPYYDNDGRFYNESGEPAVISAHC